MTRRLNEEGQASRLRILKAEGLITSPAFILMQAADRFANPTTAINQLWQTDFTHVRSPATALQSRSLNPTMSRAIS